MNYTFQDWRDFKKSLQLKNRDIANIIGLTEDSVKSMCSPKKELPAWAKAFIFSWKSTLNSK